MIDCAFCSSRPRGSARRASFSKVEPNVMPGRAVLISPVHGQLDPRILSEWMLADGLPARLQLQLHKFIWAPETRGV